MNGFRSDFHISQMSAISITAVSDLACPWCYLGKVFLDAAIASTTRPVTVRWQPYMIDPRTQPNGEPYLAYNQHRWGSDGWTYELREQAPHLFQKWVTWPNTLNAHCTLRYIRTIKGEEAENKVLSILLVQCYEEGLNISTVDTCVAAAERADLGVDSTQLRQAVASPEVRNAVIADDTSAKTKGGVHGVPNFTIEANGKKVVLDGCNPTQRWLSVFARL
jgi:predicted DsbA family dithiol-disulfide isomerase